MYFRASDFAQFLEPVLGLVKLFRSKPGDVGRLFTASSRVAIPSMFLDFDLPYVFFLTSPRDGQLIFKYAHTVVTFPKVLMMTSREDFLKRQVLVPVWLKLYRCCPPQQPDTDSLVFVETPLPDIDIPHFQKRWLMLKKLAKENMCHPMDILDRRIRLPNLDLRPEVAVDANSLCERCRAAGGSGCENCTPQKVTFIDFALHKSVAELKTQACSFETFIRYRAAFLRLSEFDHLSFNLWEAILVQFCGTLNLDVQTQLEQIFLILDTPLTKKKALIKRIYSLLTPELLSEWADLSKMLEVEWLLVLQDEKHFEKPKFDVGRVVEQLKVLPNVTQDQQYFVLIGCLKDLDALTMMHGPDRGSVAFILREATQLGLIQVLLFVSCLFMKNSDFHSLCSTKERHVWAKFEEGFLELVQGYEQFSFVYGTFQDEVLVKFSG
jgi:hypothetical protein